ncbi:MAG TPA: Hsp20/alpha crystallin family protein [Acidimicrobiales bacterium]|nr:Hsp20/alpha crystallin family protein [Acidimicrobiales bacterium]
MLLRFDPFREFDRLADELDRSVTRTTPMPMDAYRRGNHVVAHLDVPGVRPEDLDVTVERNVVTVKATRRPDVAEDDERIVGERRHGDLVRQLMLGDMLDPQRLEADVTDGVLTLRIPVAETATPRKVEVGTGAGHGAEQAALSA